MCTGTYSVLVRTVQSLYSIQMCTLALLKRPISFIFYGFFNELVLKESLFLTFFPFFLVSRVPKETVIQDFAVLETPTHLDTMQYSFRCIFKNFWFSFFLIFSSTKKIIYCICEYNFTKNKVSNQEKNKKNYLVRKLLLKGRAGASRR